MRLRWRKIMERTLPAHDLIDLVAENDAYYPRKRQFAPEYSQPAYLTMLS